MPRDFAKGRETRLGTFGQRAYFDFVGDSGMSLRELDRKCF